MNKFAERLIELRKEKNLSQRELAKKIDVSHTAIIYWESKKRKPTIDAIILLAQYFGVTSDYLIGLSEF